MSTSSLIEPGLVALDVDLGSTKDEVIRGLAGIVAATGRADAEGLAADALAREGKSATGMPGGFAIPHCRSAAVNTGSLGFARLTNPVDFGAKDGASDLVFLIAAAESGGADHMKLLTKLARALVKPDFLAALRAAGSADEIVSLVRDVVEPAADAAAPVVAAAAAAAASGPKKSIIAITACPTGIAHTYMAADYLVNAGKEMGVDVVTEPQGSTATEWVTAAQIKAASAVIFATDVGVKGRERFAGLPVIESGVKRAINEPKKMIEDALAAIDNPSAPRVAAGTGAAADSGAGAAKSQLSWGKRLQQALMTGVSYMIPFVAAGGLLIALGFLFGSYQIPYVADHILGTNSILNLPSLSEIVSAKTAAGDLMFTAAQTDALPNSGFLLFLGAALFKIGGLAFGFLVPALAGYIAFALADRPGIAPGFVAGAVAGYVGAGFLGGLVGGLVAGLVAAWIGHFKVPRWLRGLMPVVIIPLGASLITGLLMFFVLGRPLAWVLTSLTDMLNGMSGSQAVVLGIVLGLMMCFDLGGPVNKAAYLFATTGLVIGDGGSVTASMKIMATVMAAGMVPPIAMALSTTLRPKLYSEQERENGVAAWLLGASFISEGAIPFAAADPIRVIPSMMAGGAVTGALTMALGVASKAPHGGVFVFFAITKFWGFLLAIILGAIVAGLLVTVLKGMHARKLLAEDPTAAAAVQA
ncbi:MAG TPA: fructose-specific PTS transporter subunit EIIC [Propionibacteriaceae bacterium]|nr:fructose-specific PTS transporter subunit EIIC [Propionibacteriaceae bacterium]